ncbi:MAG: cytochrome C [Deltaproteobacteria bacterium]|nr:cytochrome C [Deltaproteobacteria bacterium]
MKKTVIIVSVLALVLGMAAWAVAATVVGSKHDMRSYITGETSQQVCVYCHTPHQAAAAAAQDPLWNHTLSSNGNYGVYNSSTLNATPTNFGGGTAGSANVSQLCMSCHDGTVAVNNLYKAPGDGTTGTNINVTGAALVGTDLTNDHPVNFTYDAALATADGKLISPANSSYVVAGIPLYSSTVQCASCHNVHDNANAPFLRVSNAASSLCTQCHVK